MNNKQLQDMANVLRRNVLKMTTAAESGHPTSCMSCAEIMSVLFFDEMSYDNKNPFNPDNDEFILSKGHAAPILYASLYHAGCMKTSLLSLRRLKSPLEGHPIPSTFKWVKVATGSLGQGLSVGVGMALAAKMQKRKFRTYVLLGDSEAAEGSVFEALELASHYKLNNLTAIIDANRLGQRGETMVGHRLDDYKKRFKGFGWDVLIINGHDIKQIKDAIKKSKSSKKPSLIIAKTLKGKGVSFTENKDGWHGKTMSEQELQLALSELPNPEVHKIKVKKPEKTKFSFRKDRLKQNIYSNSQDISVREAYGKVLASLASSNSSVLAVDAEVSNSSKSEEVKKVAPSQFIESFIAEQNMIGMTLGLSKKGFDVFASSFAAFLSRASDQLRMAAISSANFNVVGSHAGVSIGEDGASQMGLEDIAMMRDLPESVVLYPSDAVSTEKLTQLAFNTKKGIKYIRSTRATVPVIYKNKEKFKLGDFKVLFSSRKDKIVVAGSGITTHEAIKAYNELKKQNVHVSVVDLYCIKPFNSKKFLKFVKKHGNKLIVVEDHHFEGGIGEMLSESMENSGIKTKHLAVAGIPHSGKSEELMRKYNINWEAIIKEARKMF